MTPSLFEIVARRGWARLPPLEHAVVGSLRSLVERTSSCFERRDGFDELWGALDRERWRATQAELSERLAPFLERHFPAHRSILFNFWVKRARSPHCEVRFHRDFAVVDERRGARALQLWIPLGDVGARNGGLILIEGSQETAPAIRQHDLHDPRAMDSVKDLPCDAIRPELRAGHGVVFANGVLHGSSGNPSEHDRSAVGTVLVPRDAPLVHWVARTASRRELWSIPDDDFLELRPGTLPPHAVLLETVEVEHAQ